MQERDAVAEENAKEDNCNYRNGYLPIHLILKSGVKTTLADYTSVFKQQPPAGVRGWIDDVFMMNDMK